MHVFEVVAIDLKRFLESGVALVECPDCASTRTLSPSKGVLRFSPHDKRKTRTLHHEARWIRHKGAWELADR